MSASPAIRSMSLTREPELAGFAAMSARRLFLLGGIALILVGMVFGDIFAVFTLHQNAAQVGANLAAAAQAASPAIATKCSPISEMWARFWKIAAPRSIRTCT